MSIVNWLKKKPPNAAPNAVPNVASNVAPSTVAAFVAGATAAPSMAPNAAPNTVAAFVAGATLSLKDSNTAGTTRDINIELAPKRALAQIAHCDSSTYFKQL